MGDVYAAESWGGANLNDFIVTGFNVFGQPAFQFYASIHEDLAEGGFYEQYSQTW
jgi:hypothetical protein